jgi:hypothetical protein
LGSFPGMPVVGALAAVSRRERSWSFKGIRAKVAAGLADGRTMLLRIKAKGRNQNRARSGFPYIFPCIRPDVLTLSPVMGMLLAHAINNIAEITHLIWFI